MFIKILKKDIKRNKIITITLFVFILLAALLVSSAANIILGLTGAMDHLFMDSKAPHFVQMHAGDLNQADIDLFSKENGLVKEQQTAEMIGIDGTNIYLDNRMEPEADSVMDVSFVKQNNSFDLLLNLESQVIQVGQGEIGVPIYYMQEKNMSIGDQVMISDGPFQCVFTVTDFVRDVQMNPSIISSKRFVVNEEDFNAIKKNTGEIEYLIEFQLKDIKSLENFASEYQNAGLPQKGPAIDISLLKMANALTDGIVAAVIILVSLLLIGIAFLCLRFTMIATMEEDFREIGIMKAIGISGRHIRQIYLTKYMAMAAGASLAGYLLSILLSQVFTRNITLYMGTSEKTMLQLLIPVLGSVVVFVLVVLFCYLTLGRFRRITVVDAIRAGRMVEKPVGGNRIQLRKSRFLSVNIFLGLKDVVERFRVFALLCIVFILCSFMMIVPVNILNTIQSPVFITYMGTGSSDIRIDLRQTENVGIRFDQMMETLGKDQDVERVSPLITYKMKALNTDGVYENINVEMGDFNVFPLAYLTGSAPQKPGEIALSYLNAKGFEKKTGDRISLMINGKEEELIVTGIYQDVTNGGKTAKITEIKQASLANTKDPVLWYVVNVDVKEGVPLGEKKKDYSEEFYPAKATYMEDYMSQTFGSTIRQLKLLTGFSLAIAAFVSMLITSLFLKMLITKDAGETAVMKSIGFRLRDIQVQYQARTIFVLAIGILLGTLAANTLGQKGVSVMGAFLGMPDIRFVVNPVTAYLACPALLIVAVTVTTLASTLFVKKTSITENMEE